MLVALIPDSWARKVSFHECREEKKELTLRNSVRADVGPRTLLGRLIGEKRKD